MHSLDGILNDDRRVKQIMVAHLNVMLVPSSSLVI